MIRNIPCSTQRIPCFRREQGIRRNALDLQLELMPKGAKTGPHRPVFRKFPDHFHCSQGIGGLAAVSERRVQSPYCAAAADRFAAFQDGRAP
jgi:hypothetical protein